MTDCIELTQAKVFMNNCEVTDRVIGFVTPYVDNHGGGEVYIDNLVKYGNEKKIGKFLLFTSDPGAFSQQTIWIPDISNYKNFFMNYRKLLSILELYNVNTIVLNDYYLSQFSVLFKHHFSKVIALIHGEINHNRIKNSLLKKMVVFSRMFLVYIGSSAILSVNKTNLRLFKYNNKVRYVGNFIMPLDYRKESRDNEYDFIFVGRLVKEKNLEFLLEVFNKYIETIDKSSKLLIVGDGIERDRIQRFIQTHDLDKSVCLAGNVSHELICEYYNKAKVLLLFSITEGFPTVILEALQMGIPCVVSNVGSNRDVIIDGINGYVFDQNVSIDLIVKYMFAAKTIDSSSCVDSIREYLIDTFFSRFMNEIYEA